MKEPRFPQVSVYSFELLSKLVCKEGYWKEINFLSFNKWKFLESVLLKLSRAIGVLFREINFWKSCIQVEKSFHINRFILIYQTIFILSKPTFMPFQSIPFVGKRLGGRGKKVFLFWQILHFQFISAIKHSKRKLQFYTSIISVEA